MKKMYKIKNIAKPFDFTTKGAIGVKDGCIQGSFSNGPMDWYIRMRPDLEHDEFMITLLAEFSYFLVDIQSPIKATDLGDEYMLQYGDKKRQFPKAELKPISDEGFGKIGTIKSYPLFRLGWQVMHRYHDVPYFHYMLLSDRYVGLATRKFIMYVKRPELIGIRLERPIAIDSLGVRLLKRLGNVKVDVYKKGAQCMFKVDNDIVIGSPNKNVHFPIYKIKPNNNKARINYSKELKHFKDILPVTGYDLDTFIGAENDFVRIFVNKKFMDT